MRWHLWLLLPTALFVLIGCGGGNGGPTPRDTEPPRISGFLVRISPTPQVTGASVDLPFTGGVVQVQATVTDPSGVAEVVLRMERDGQPIEERSLTPDPNGNVAAQFSLPPTELQDQRYTFRLRARDQLGNQGEAVVGTATVRSPLGSPPPPPPF